MKFSHQIIDDVLVITFEENLILTSMDIILLNLIDECVHNEIIFCAIDLSQIRFMNSSGIGVLVRILTKFRAKNGEVVLIKPSSDIYKLLIITKLSAIFTIAENQNEAIQILKSSEV